MLVTGADGFVGSHLVRGLQSAGHDVTGVVFGRPARGRELRVDLTVERALDALPDEVDAVVHAAGIVDATLPSSLMYDVNVGGTSNLVAWARAQQVRHFVQLSSVAVYGPLVVGADRSENTPRLGLALGLPYMRTKAHAERVIERSGVPYTLLRPPAILGPGDTVISAGFSEALHGAGIPLLPGGSPQRKVAVSFVSGLCDLTALILSRGPQRRAIHALDAALSLAALARHYADALALPLRFTSARVGDAVSRRNDAGYAWLVASGLAGQHYSARRLHDELGYRPRLTVAEAVAQAVTTLASGAQRTSRSR